MSNANKIGSLALAMALLFAPFTPIISSTATARALRQDPDVPSDAEQAMFTKGQTLYTQGRYEQAADLLKDFLKTYPNSIITDLTLLWLGRSYLQMGKFDEAEKVAQRLRAIKDTPFADIYDGELASARREAPRPGPTQALAANRSNTNQSASAPPTARPSPTASVTPTPTRSPLTASNVRPPTTPTGTPSQANTNTSITGGQAATGASPTRTPRLISTAPSPQPETTPTDATQLANNRQPTGRSGRRVRGGPQRPEQNVAGNNRTEQGTTARPTQTTANVQPSPPPPRNVAPPVSSSPNTSVASRRALTPAPGAETGSSEASPSQGGVGLTLNVKQVPNLVLALRRTAETASPGQTVQLPLTITNTGNKEDQFRLETDLPAEYQPSYSLAQGGSDTQLPILVTPLLAREQSVEVLLNLRVPETATDGQQRRFFVRAASQFDYQVHRVADGTINVIAATLDANSSVSQTSVMPSETFTQTITVRNAGSAPARSSRADFVFNPNVELVSANPSPLVYDRPSRTAIWSLGDLAARGSREIAVTLRAVPDALAATTSLGRGTLRTQSLPLGSNFDSPSITIGKVPRARIDAVSVGLTVTPGDTMFVPFVVRNPGNAPDAYELRITAPNAPAATIYADSNGDGQHQENEPAITQTPQLSPQGGQFPVLLRVLIPSSTPDRQQYSYNVVARSLTSNRIASEANTVLTVATPRVRVRTEQVTDTPAPGDTIFYRMVLLNEGSGLAKNLVVTETLPEALQFVSSEPSLTAQDAPGSAQRIVWRVPELAPGDTAVLRIAVRLRPNLPANTNLTTRHTLSYQDSNNNSYQGQ